MQDKDCHNPTGLLEMSPDWKRKAVLFLSSQTISLFGSALVQYAITWHITLETKSGAMMTAAILCGFLPTFLISPFAGVWADRYNRKHLIVMADALIAVATLGLAGLFLMGYDAIWLLFVISAIRALGSGVQMPAVSAILPQLVPAAKLTRINATNGSLQSLVTLVSPMLAGALLTVAAIEAIFFIDVFTAAVAIAILLFLRVPTHAKALGKQATGYFTDMLGGLRYIHRHAFVRVLFLFGALFFFLAAPVAFLPPLQVARNFGDDVWRLAAIEVAFSVGMLMGGLAMASWGGFKNKARSLAFAGLIMGAFTFALGVTPFFWLYLVFMAILGVSMPVFNTPAMVLLQQKVEEDFLGRVFGVMGMITSIMMPLGMLVFGPLADLVKIEWLLIGSGILIFIVGICMWWNRILVQAGKPMGELGGAPTKHGALP
ncbi:MAG: MFS transporter [Dehalococcoidia bacterium]|nr:MFS transporter [Dehalococcoidia bacterium]